MPAAKTALVGVEEEKEEARLAADGDKNAALRDGVGGTCIDVSGMSMLSLMGVGVAGTAAAAANTSGDSGGAIGITHEDITNETVASYYDRWM